jgi:hypothetical protein
MYPPLLNPLFLSRSQNERLAAHQYSTPCFFFLNFTWEQDDHRCVLGEVLHMLKVLKV